MDDAHSAHNAHMARHHASSDDARYAQSYPRVNFNYFPDAVYVLRSQGQDNKCGCPGTAGTISCASGPFLPDELNDIMTFEEFKVLCSKVNEVMRINHCPVLTFFGPLVILPPIIILASCIESTCHSRRFDRLTAIVEEQNKFLYERGAYWEVIRYNKNVGCFMQLKVNKTAHARYLATKGAVQAVGMEVRAIDTPPVVTTVELVSSAIGYNKVIPV